jgi:hypothetical protein
MGWFKKALNIVSPITNLGKGNPKKFFGLQDKKPQQQTPFSDFQVQPEWYKALAENAYAQLGRLTQDSSLFAPTVVDPTSTDFRNRLGEATKTFTNPFESGVIQNLFNDLEGIKAQTRARTSSTGAFGSSSQGVEDALSNQLALKNAGDFRFQNFNNAQNQGLSALSNYYSQNDAARQAPLQALQALLSGVNAFKSNAINPTVIQPQGTLDKIAKIGQALGGASGGASVLAAL